MKSRHEQLLESVFAERERLMSRRGLVMGGAKVAASGALALSIVGSPAIGKMSAMAQDATPMTMGFEDDIDVLNYALTLEHLEYSFYRDGVGQFDLGTGPFGNDIGTLLMEIRDHELAHVEALTAVITQLGGEPVAEATYDFGYTDAASFLATAAALENTGVAAYDGAGAAIENPELLTAAGSIVAVEARHASFLNLIIGEIPFPASFETPATREEILAIAGPFIVG